CAEPVLDCNGDLWLRDFGYRDAGKLAACPDRHTLGPACALRGVAAAMSCEDAPTRRIFRCGRRAAKHSAVAYAFDLAPGEYLVNLFFAAGALRQPDRVGTGGATIRVNGAVAYDAFDPADVAGMTGKVVVRSAAVVVHDEGLHVEIAG